LPRAAAASTESPTNCACLLAHAAACCLLTAAVVHVSGSNITNSASTSRHLVFVVISWRGRPRFGAQTPCLCSKPGISSCLCLLTFK
jgi:hypothetical protein